MHRRPTSLLVLVCNNGYGHYKRIINIVSTLLRNTENIRPQISCSPAARRQFANWPVAEFVWRHCDWIEEDLGGGPMWFQEAEFYRQRPWDHWQARQRESRAVARADHVWSDNLTDILEHRGDTVLSGSFLWSDVLHAAYPEHEAVADYVARERELLSRFQPPMITVELFATEGVRQRTRMMGCDLMIEDAYRSGREQRDAFALFPGGEQPGRSAFEAHLEEIAEAFRDELMFYPRDWRPVFPDGPRWQPFDFSDASWARLKGAIVRPGMGVVHDCLSRVIPMFVLAEDSNMEMRHTGDLLIEQGLAADFRNDDQHALEAWKSPQILDHISERIAALPHRGIEQAARFLHERVA